MAKNREMDLVNGPLIKNFFIFALPLMLTNLLQHLFNAVDTIVVGKFAGDTALAAVGATGSMIFMCTALFNGISMGANVYVAQQIGKGDRQKVTRSVSSIYALAILCGCFMSLIGLFGSGVLLNLVNTPESIINESTLYMRIYLSGSIFNLIYNFGAAILRAKGDTKSSLIYLTISGILNAGLNIYLVAIWHLDVIGVAIATVFSQFISALLVTINLVKDAGITHLDLKKIALEKESVSQTLRIGIPTGIQIMMYSISNVVIQSSLNSFSSAAVIAGNTAGQNIENICYIGMLGFSQAGTTFTSQNYGAGKKEKLGKIMYLSLLLSVLIALPISALAYLLRYQLLGLFTSGEEVLYYGSLRILYVVVPLVTNGILDVFVGSMRGMGRSTLPTIVMIIGICGVRLAWLLTYFPLHRSVQVIYLSFPISWIITSIVEYILWLYIYHHQILKNN